MPLMEKSSKRLVVWKDGTMSIVRRATLIGASLNNSPIYHMSVYLLPKMTINSLDKIGRIFF